MAFGDSQWPDRCWPARVQAALHFLQPFSAISSHDAKTSRAELIPASNFLARLLAQRNPAPSWHRAGDVRNRWQAPQRLEGPRAPRAVLIPTRVPQPDRARAAFCAVRQAPTTPEFRWFAEGRPPAPGGKWKGTI